MKCTQAKAQLDQLLAEPRAEDIGVAEAQVQQSQTALGGARIALAKTVLVTPLSGAVGKVMVEEGETVMAGVPVLMVGDLRALQVETDNLSEVDIVEVAVGQEVKVSFPPDCGKSSWSSPGSGLTPKRLASPGRLEKHQSQSGRTCCTAGFG